ncbi:MAG: LysM peptidoglycan-binding domain-containing protein [Rhizobiaceae bacterium]
MRTQLLRNRIRLTGQVATIAILAGLASGCSSDFTRFDKSLYTASTSPAASSGVVEGNPYPGDVDGTTTASVGSRLSGPAPVDTVSARPVTADHAGYQPYQQAAPATTYAAPRPTSPYVAPQSVQRADLPKPALAPSVQKTATVSRPVVQKPATTTSVAQARPLLAPPTSSSVDRMTTSAVNSAPGPQAQSTTTQHTDSQIASNLPDATNQRGWTNAGGTAVTLQPGETLYNLSKRYGVPVSALMKANGISDANQIQAGQRIIVPTYVYASNVPVSAPDSDPNTHAARSSRGNLYDPSSAVPLPEQRPMTVAGLPSGGTTAQKSDPRYVPQRRAQPPAADHNVPDYSITTGSVRQGTSNYVVASGDTLSRIAARNSVSVNDLMQANGLTSSNIRLGQKLVIPTAGTSQVAAANSAPSGVDPIVTGSSNAGAAQPKPYTKPSTDASVNERIASNDTTAPARTGIDQFRWPVTGRIISNFGDKTALGRNDGIDISVPEGTAVKAAENGVVVYAGSELEGFGNLVLIRHDGGWVSAYAHNRSIEVKRGAEVRRGEIIARSGRTGSAEMPKLHFELRKSSTPVDPLKHLDKS